MNAATNIVALLLENDDEIDPKEYALSGVDPKTVYYPIVFMQNDDSNEAFRIMDDQGESAALEHLKQWDYGRESEHAPEHEPPYADFDDTLSIDCAGGEYTMAWNRSMGYISLTRSKHYLYGLPDRK
jgi:hypothetical protein